MSSLCCLSFAPSRLFEDVADLPRERYPREPFIGRIWALRDDFTAYDAAYAALDEVLALR